MVVVKYILYLIVPTFLSLVIYYYCAPFKKMATMPLEELNEDDESEEDNVSPNEAKAINIFGLTTFIVTSTYVWGLLGITIGKTVSLIAPANFLKWPLYISIYFIFLRIPFGVGNKMIKRAHDFEEFNEKIIFSLAMILGFIFSICCYDSLPGLLKWQLYFLT